jgi:hypothetical protein
VKLAICGDSWFSGDVKYPGRSFGELLCGKNQWELISLALGGCSAFAICLQVDKAIELGADFIVIGTTTPDRIDIPIMNHGVPVPFQSVRDFFSWDNYFKHNPSVFDRYRGLSNISYDSDYLSSQNDFLTEPTIYSATMANLLWLRDSKKLTVEQAEALKLYMTNLYDMGVKRETDVRLYSDACHRLDRAGIPYLLCIESLDSDRTQFPLIDSDKIMTMDQFQFGALPRSSAMFHYCTEVGGQPFADYIETRITQLMDQQ